jgi:hypothetical protein
MHKSGVILTVLGLGSIMAGIGAYELGIHRGSADSSYTPQTEGASPSSAYVPQTFDGAPASIPSNGTASPGQPLLNQSGGQMDKDGKLIGMAPVAAPSDGSGEKITTNMTTGSSQNTIPQTVGAVPTVPGNSYMQQATTETTTTSAKPKIHRAYVRSSAHHKRHDKVHLGRAVKHTTEFALKLPGRAAL